MQVFAQKLCIDFVFGGHCKGVIYYGDVKKRVALPLQEHFQQYDDFLRKTLEEMRDYLEEGKIPPIRKNQKCSGCSMKDLCMPSMKKINDVRNEIEKIERASI